MCSEGVIIRRKMKNFLYLDAETSVYQHEVSGKISVIHVSLTRENDDDRDSIVFTEKQFDTIVKQYLENKNEKREA